MLHHANATHLLEVLDPPHTRTHTQHNQQEVSLPRHVLREDQVEEIANRRLGHCDLFNPFLTKDAKV